MCARDLKEHNKNYRTFLLADEQRTDKKLHWKTLLIQDEESAKDTHDRASTQEAMKNRQEGYDAWIHGSQDGKPSENTHDILDHEESATPMTDHQILPVKRGVRNNAQRLGQECEQTRRGGKGENIGEHVTIWNWISSPIPVDIGSLGQADSKRARDTGKHKQNTLVDRSYMCVLCCTVEPCLQSEK